MSSPRNPKIPPPPLILPPSSSSPLSLSPHHPSPSLIPVSFFGSLQYSFSVRVGTDHYGALDNPATLLHPRQPTTTHNNPVNHPGPSLPTVRASRFIRDLPLPRTYRHPRHWFLVQAFSPVAHTINCGAPCTFYGDTLDILTPRPSTLCGLLLSLLEVLWARASCITNFSGPPCSYFVLISCFESDSTSSLYTIFHYYIPIKGQAGIERVVC